MWISILPFIAIVQTAGTPSQIETVPPIIVEGERAEAELERCLARDCAADEDALASIRKARAEFAQGNYRAARQTILAAIARTRDQVELHPEAVSALWGAHSRIAAHSGDSREFRRGALRSASILRNAVRLTEEQQLLGQLQLGDAYGVAGDLRSAMRVYAEAAKRAEQSGLTRIAGLIEVRKIRVQRHFGDARGARAQFEAIVADPAADPLVRWAAAQGLARMADSHEEAETIMAGLQIAPKDAVARVAPIWESPRPQSPQEALSRELVEFDAGLFQSSITNATGKGDVAWVDIGFYVTPEGKVEDVAIVRSSSRDTRWVRLAEEYIASRRYTPSASGPGGRVYKVERVTQTRERIRRVGSHVPARLGPPVYEFEDVSAALAGNVPSSPTGADLKTSNPH